MTSARRLFLARAGAVSLGALGLAGCSILPEPVASKFPERVPDVPYVPTRLETVHAMLRVAGVGPGDVVYDLGCGDGRIVVLAAKEYGARGVGIDIDPARIAEANENARDAGVTDRVRFLVGDIFKADISEATVVTLYLLPTVNERLKPKLRSELAPGTRIVSHDFDMGEDWPPEKRYELTPSKIYFWTVPPR